MIGEDGRMNEEAGDVRGPDRRRGARARRRRRCATQGALRGEEPYTHSVPVLAPLRRADRAADLAAVVLRMDELAAPAIEVVDERPRADPPRVAVARVYLDWMENIRPWCISRQLWWGHQLPVWYRGDDETHVGDGAARRATGWRREDGRPRHLVQHRAVAVRDARLARRDARAARLLPDRRALDGARHPLPLGRADGDDGPRASPATSRSTTSTCTR